MGSHLGQLTTATHSERGNYTTLSFVGKGGSPYLEGHDEMSEMKFCFQIQLDSDILHAYRVIFKKINGNSNVNKNICEQLSLSSSTIFVLLTEILSAVHLNLKIR